MLAEWGLRDGDLVIAIDGIPLDTRRKRDDVFTYISFRESVVLTLDRGGTLLEVPVEWPESPPNLGGRLDPAAR